MSTNRTNRILVVGLIALLLPACEITTSRNAPGEGIQVRTSRIEREPPRTPASARAGVEATLDALHRLASQADGAHYFALFAPDAIFFGTDPDERWTVDEFRIYAEPYFSKGRGWTYQVLERHVFLDDSGDTAWFDERLYNEKNGECRGTGVLRELEGRWFIAQYSLSMPVPNDLAPTLVEMIREQR
jgi:hypothetical protein